MLWQVLFWFHCLQFVPCGPLWILLLILNDSCFGLMVVLVTLAGSCFGLVVLLAALEFSGSTKPPKFALATDNHCAIDLSCRACDACGAGAGCWAWIPGGGLRSAPFSTPNLRLI